MTTTDKILTEIEEWGHYAFKDKYDYTRFVNSLNENQKIGLIFVEKDWSVFVT